jgi:NAD(P)-dependent dehydrogenase (short-subunit alcohol dehydrogenase family)
MTRWAASDIPALDGRTAVVTGANSGLGFHTALELARHGAHVVLACRDASRGQAALERIRSVAPEAAVELDELDLADLASVRKFAGARGQTLDVLVNNAGVMAIPRRETADGFEMQLGTNHLGHFALTALLMPALLARPGARVVTVSSTVHRSGSIHFDDLMLERGYRPWKAYSQSKLANLLFAYELDRRARAAGRELASVAAHPGYAATNLQSVGPRERGSRLGVAVMRAANAVLAQSDAMGALPSLYAATAPAVEGGQYFGPGGIAQQRGYPKLVESNRASHDLDVARRLWEVSEELTGVRFSLA